jgi:hypothetical protein
MNARECAADESKSFLVMVKRSFFHQVTDVVCVTGFEKKGHTMASIVLTIG